MRKVLLSSLVFGALIGAAGAAMTSSAPTAGMRSRPPLAGPLDPARPADRRMIAFGEAHPDCPLWTNWEKLCSRTGRAGRVACNLDRQRRVSPSTPFCAGGFPGNPQNQQGEALRSSERFCTRRELLHGISARGEEPPVLICTRHDPRRPFNGRRLAALDQPACQTWVDQRTLRPVCTKVGAGRRGIPSCATLVASGYEHSDLLLCARWTRVSNCRDLQPTVRTASRAEIFIDDPISLDSFPVRGVHCESEDE